jgi:hypothetical protein
MSVFDWEPYVNQVLVSAQDILSLESLDQSTSLALIESSSAETSDSNFVTLIQHGNASFQHGNASFQHGNAFSKHGHAFSKHGHAFSKHCNASSQTIVDP